MLKVNVYIRQLKIITQYKIIMPKMKTNSSAKKRFSITGTGKIKRKHAYKRHILTKKTTKQKRALTHSGLVHERDASRIRLLLVK